MSEAWLKVARAPALDGRRLLELLPTVTSVEALLALPAGALRQLGLEPATVDALKTPDPQLLAEDLAWLERDGAQLLPIDHEDYPALLRRIPDPPPVLFLRGDPAVLWQPQLAIVGSRNPTRSGREHAKDFAAALSRSGLTITSGAAAGIDASAHEGALAAGGQTIAVLGTGPDLVYPSRHDALLDAIARQGVVVSEFPPGTPPRKGNFPRRNRIISGLALGVLVVEAALASGSLITARLAGEQGREVFALPGSLHNPMARGCHRLIKQGARLVESTEDIVSELSAMAGELAGALERRLATDAGGPAAGEGPSGPAPGLELLEDPEYRALWQALDHDPVSQDRLVERTGLDARALSSMLLMMELQGLVTTEVGGRVARAPGSPEEAQAPAS